MKVESRNSKLENIRPLLRSAFVVFYFLFSPFAFPQTHTRISALPAKTTPSASDVFPVVDTTGQAWKVRIDAITATGGGTGDVVGPSSSLDSEIALFSSTTGKLLKRGNALNGIQKFTNGVPSPAVSGTDFVLPSDTRFPASVTGIRKSAGAGSTDVAATAGTDYALPSDTRFPASVTGIRKGAGAGSTDTAAVANVDYAKKQETTAGNTSFTWPSSVTTIRITTALTANPTCTLPLANSFASGTVIEFIDPLTTGPFGYAFQRQGTDTLNSGTVPVTPFIAGGIGGGASVARFETNGLTSWRLLDTNLRVLTMRDTSNPDKQAFFSLAALAPGTPVTISVAPDFDSVTVVPVLGGSGEYVNGVNADGTLSFGTPAGGAGSPGGPDRAVQFNDAGTQNGDANLLWNKVTTELKLVGGNPGLIVGASASRPAAPSGGLIKYYTETMAGKATARIIGPQGIDTALQSALWDMAFVLWCPSANASGTTLGSSVSQGGTFAAVMPTTTNRYTASRRSTYSSVATTTNQTIGVTGADAMFFRGTAGAQGGFFFFCRFGIESWVAGDRVFVGFTATGAGSVMNGVPSSMSNILGFLVDDGESTLSFGHNDGSGTATKDAITGATAVASQGYDAYIFCKPNDTTIYYRLDNVNTGATLIDGSTTTDLPGATGMMRAVATVGNGTNAAANDAKIGLAKIYLETVR
jgi:hypothetical protein